MPTREQILGAVARNLREFGYPDCTADNVLTTYLFGQFAKSQLEDFMELNPSTSDIVQPMLDEIAALKSPYT